MRYILKQRPFALLDRFTVRDAMGRDVYLIDGQIALSHTFRVSDIAGRELAVVRRDLAYPLCAKYDIYRGGALLASVSKDCLTLFRSHYDIRICNGEEVVAQGDCFSLDYTLTWRGIAIASISQQGILVDSYAVDVTDGHDPVPILAIAVIIDHCRNA